METFFKRNIKILIFQSTTEWVDLQSLIKNLLLYSYQSSYVIKKKTQKFISPTTIHNSIQGTHTRTHSVCLSVSGKCTHTSECKYLNYFPFLCCYCCFSCCFCIFLNNLFLDFFSFSDLLLNDMTTCSSGSKRRRENDSKVEKQLHRQCVVFFFVFSVINIHSYALCPSANCTVIYCFLRIDRFAFFMKAILYFYIWNDNSWVQFLKASNVGRK